MANPHVYTDGSGRILEISSDGAKILNLTGRGGHGRQIAHFIVHDRNKLVEEIACAARGHAVTFATTFRPLERAPKGVVLRICRVLDAPAVQLAWNFELTGAQRERPTPRRHHDAA
jgi:hypothetical protein